MDVDRLLLSRRETHGAKLVTLDPVIPAFLTAIGALSTAVLALWRRVETLHAARRDDQAKASRLIFALLQRRHDERGEDSPPTLSEWDDEPTTQVTARQFVEAQAHAKAELNGDIEGLVKRYLASTPPPVEPKDK